MAQHTSHAKTLPDLNVDGQGTGTPYLDGVTAGARTGSRTIDVAVLRHRPVAAKSEDADAFRIEPCFSTGRSGSRGFGERRGAGAHHQEQPARGNGQGLGRPMNSMEHRTRRRVQRAGDSMAQRECGHRINSLVVSFPSRLDMKRAVNNMSLRLPKGLSATASKACSAVRPIIAPTCPKWIPPPARK